MGTYQNAYHMLSDLRMGMGEYSSALLQGTSTSGKFNNDWLMRIGINGAQRLLYDILVKYIREEFLEYTTIVGSNSEYTLPWDYGTVLEFRDEDGYKVHPVDPRHLPIDSGAGSDRLYYKKGNKFILTKSGVTDTYKLWYQRMPRDLDQGSLTYSAPTTTLAASAKLIADYYNGMTMEDVTAGWVDTITDYTAARVVTISETPVTADYYGMVSDIPEPFHHLIVPRAIMECKALHPHTKEKPTAASRTQWGEQVIDAIRGFAGSKADVEPEEIWCDFSVGPGYPGHNIPGQGYTIY